jgi:uncharacterized repeat protein (TIGR02543 family)
MTKSIHRGGVGIFLRLAACLFLATSIGCAKGSGGDDGSDSYTIRYDANGATGGSVPVDSASYEEGQKVTVLSNVGNLVKSGYAFKGWNTRADGKGSDYKASQSFSMGSSDITLYASWKKAIMVFITYSDDEYPIYKMNQDGSGSATLVSPATGVYDYPTLSSDQERLLFSVYDSGRIYIIGIDNGGAALPDPLVDLGTSKVYYPAFSKDGTKIAFRVYSATAGISGIYIADASTGAYSRIQNSTSEADHPSWSPDGSLIVYGDSDGKLYTISATDASDSPHLLTSGSWPIWAPTGGRIAFRGSAGLGLTAYGESSSSSLTNPGGPSDLPDYWSPDGSLVIFERYTGDYPDIFSVSVDGLVETNITDSPDDAEFCYNG